MNLVIKPILFDYEDTYFTDETRYDAYGIFDWTPSKRKVRNNLDGTWRQWTQDSPYPYEWIAAFKEKADAEFYLNWKKEQIK